MDDSISLPSPIFDAGFYSIPVSPALLEIPERITAFADKADFKQKDEIHFTVMSGKLLHRSGAHQFITEMDDLIDDIRDWDIRFQNKYYLMAKRSQDGSTKQAIIQLLTVPALEELYESLRKEKIVPTDTPTPIAHITLFTKFDDNGISINSQDDFDDYVIRQIY